MSTLFMVSAPSGAGKTTLVKALVAAIPSVELSVSHTTRPQREGEVDGQDYHFIDEAGFMQKVAKGEFLEHAKVFGHYYGTSELELDKQLALGADVILEIDWQGAMQVKKARADAVGIFILPPSRQTLEERLKGRGKDSEAVISNRLSQAAEEISHYLESDYLIVNDDFDRALEELTIIIRSQALKLDMQKDRYKDLIVALLKCSD